MFDPLTITNVAATSAQGGVLTNNGTTVDYTAPARNFVGDGHLHLHGERRDSSTPTWRR